MARRRRRISASSRAPSPTKGLVQLVLVAVALALILLYKAGVGEQTAGFIDHVAKDPQLALPPSVLDQVVPDAGPVDARGPR